MEIWRIAIPIIVMIVTTIGAYCVVSIMAKKGNEKRAYVCPKTGHKYIPLFRCKLKCPADGEWFDALIYQGLDDGGKLYVRERKDFFDKFVKLLDWKKNEKVSTNRESGKS